MAALSYYQLVQLVESIKAFVLGSQLQEIALSERHLFLQHYNKGSLTLGFDLNPLSPTMGFFFGDIPKRKFLVKPLVLFLKAHVRNLRLQDISVDAEKGRVIVFEYGNEERRASIEVRLIPHGVNVIVQSGSKSISLFPARLLPPSTHPGSDQNPDFDVESYLNTWCETQLLSSQGKKARSESMDREQWEKTRNKEISKRKTLIEKLARDLEAMNKPWQDLGEFLNFPMRSSDEAPGGRPSEFESSRTPSAMMDHVPEEWRALLDPQLPLKANRQMCFDKHKNQERRRKQVEDRMAVLKEEITQLEATLGEDSFGSWDGSSSSRPSFLGGPKHAPRPLHSVGSELLNKAKAKGRKMLIEEGVEAVFGKSAKDNLALLRRAQAWDLWVHLRDLPGAYLIVRRPRHRRVDQTQLLKAARWLLSETLGKKKVIEGDRYDLIVTECRYVRPIKGDRLGRVTFQNETTLSLRL